MTRTMRWTVAAVVTAGAFVTLGAAPAMAVDPVTTASAVPGLLANCGPPASNSANGGIQTVNGIAFTSESGECTTTQAHAAVGASNFGANQILSADSRCTVNGTPFSVAVYNGMTITATTTVVTPDGYTLNFNVPVMVGTESGRIAVQVVSPNGVVTNIAETLCMGAAYPLSANLNTSSPQELSPIAAPGHRGGVSSAMMLLVGALVAFVVVNLTAVRQFRRRHNGTAA